jgi:hypothetical protein
MFHGPDAGSWCNSFVGAFHEISSILSTAFCELRERGLSEIPPSTAKNCLCVARSRLAPFSGAPDYSRAARVIIKDYANGKLLFCHTPHSTCTNLTALTAETVFTALQQTKRLREKLLRQQQQVEKGNEGAKVVQCQRKSSQQASGEDAMDEALLALIGASAPPDNMALPTGKKDHHNYKKGTSPKQKWGKNNRNKDPYDCHSTPDLLALYNNNVSGGAGMTVNAGQKR